MSRRRAVLLVEVDLAEVGELSTVNHWRILLQRQLDDFAGSFRPYVRGTVAPESATRASQAQQNAAR